LTVSLGRGNPLLKRIRSLRREAGMREEQKVFVAEGPNLADAALDSRASIELAVIDSRLTTYERGRELADRLERSGVPLYEVAESVMHSLQDARQPQAVLVLVRHEPLAELPVWRRTALVAVAHGVQDPGNLGSLMRTAEAAGAAAFVCSGPGADIHHPRTLRATAGSIFRLPTIALPSADICTALGSRGLRLVGATPRDGERYDQTDFTCPTAILFGGEGAGLPNSILERLDQTVHVPMRSAVESLSVGAAAAVILIEAARQRSSSSRESSSG
jgi:TrmH family RNA methyltransferase